jgi:hypothetical protein
MTNESSLDGGFGRWNETRMQRVGIVKCAACVLIVAACGSEKIEEMTFQDERVPMRPPPERGFQIQLPEMQLPPSKETTVCWYTTFSSEEDVWIDRLEWWQGTSGHHLAMFFTLEDVPDGTIIDCENPTNMANWRPLFLPAPDDKFEMPEGMALRVPAKSRLVAQIHYVNARVTPLKVQDLVHLELAPAGVDPIPAANFPMGVVELEIPPGQDYSVSFDCPVENEVKAFAAVGHMHEHGRSFKIELGHEGTITEIYSVPEWRVEYRDTPQLKRWEVADALPLVPGDFVRTTCTWHSTDQQVVEFPYEMCVSQLWIFPMVDPTACFGRPR